MAKDKQLDALEDAAPGVGVVKDRKLNALADEFTEKRDAKAELAEQMTGSRRRFWIAWIEIGVKVFRYADRIVSIKDGSVTSKSSR